MRHTVGRRGAAAAACLLTLSLATACENGESVTAPPPTGDASGTITVASGLDLTAGGGVRQRLIAEWNHRNPEHRAELVELSGDADEQRSQLLGALQSGSTSYDVVNLDVTWVPEFAEAGLISPLDGEIDLGDFIDRVADTATWKGNLYSVPFNSDVGLLYYRQDYLKGAGIPHLRGANAGWSWDDLGDTIDTLDKQEGLPASYLNGWTSQLDSYEGLTVNVIEAFASAGVRLTDEEGRYTADESELREGLDSLRDRAGEKRLLPRALESNEADSLADFAAGRTAFLRHWPYAYGVLRGALPKGSFDVTRLPGRAALGGQNLAVAADSPRGRWALKLIEFLTGPESERCLLEAGFAATRESAYSDSSVTCELADGAADGTEGGTPASLEEGEEVRPVPVDAAGRPVYASELHDALTEAESRPRTPYYGALTQVLQSHVHRWLERDFRDPGAVADSLDRELREVLKGH
ncbi:extracellular solute-binding protein [Streptomyces carminius]|uniref:extracellular solute-binding protein n=1 Tax=Streptomyces carminius TaxID=2665496 RepID=UPI0013045642|nr:extracellular solute-binding protein [Streptomyces carminius]